MNWYIFSIFIWFGICVVHGLCRAFYDTGLETGKRQGDQKFLLLDRNGPGFNIYCPPGSESMLDDLKKEFDRAARLRSKWYETQQTSIDGM